MTRDDARARVAKGAAHLDQVRPGWWTRIDVGTLTLHDPCGCIVGQLCGTGRLFQRGLKQLEVADAVAFGFDRDVVDAGGWVTSVGAYHHEGRRLYRLLQDAWIEEIADRLVTGGAPPAVPVPAPEGVATHDG